MRPVPLAFFAAALLALTDLSCDSSESRGVKLNDVIVTAVQPKTRTLVNGLQKACS